MATRTAKKPASKKKKTSTKPRKRESSYPSFLIDDSPRRTAVRKKTKTTTKRKTKSKTKPKSAPRKPVAAKPKMASKTVRSASMPDFMSYESGETKYVERRERKPKTEKMRKERPTRRERPSDGLGYEVKGETPSKGEETAKKRERRGMFDDDDAREVRKAFGNLSETVRRGIKTLTKGRNASEGSKPVERDSTASELGKQKTIYDVTPKSRQPVDPLDEDEATITDMSNDPIYEDCSKYKTEQERNLCKHRKRKAVAERYPDVYSGE